MIEELKKSEHGAICAAANRQALISAVALAVYIKEEIGKEFRVVYAGKTEEIDGLLYQHAEIKNYFSDKTLRISVDYSGTDVSAVNWEKNDQIGKFSFYIDSVNNTFDLSRVKVDFEGKDTDIVILVGANSASELGQFYEKNKRDFEKAKIITIQADDTKNGLIATLMKKFMDWKYTPSEKVSAILLYGLQEILSAKPERSESVEAIELDKEDKMGVYNYLVD